MRINICGLASCGLVAETDGRGNTTRTAYDALGRVSSVTDAAGFATAFAYDALGRQVASTDQLGNVTHTSYDPEGLVVARWGATYPVFYTYDAFGDLATLTTFRDAAAPLSPERGDTTRWLRDAATGLVTNKLYADGLGPSYTYTPDGKLATRTWARGIVTTYAYDAWGNLTNVVYSDGEEESYAYDSLGQQVTVSNSVAIVALSRDVFGRVTNETANVGGEVQSLVREFDSLGRLSAINGTSYGYDFVGRLASVSSTMAVVTYRYTSDGLDEGYTLTLANGTIFARTVVRDPQRRHLVTAITNSVNGVPVETFAYACDALGRPVSRNGDAFGYNERSEVTSATVADTPALYGYDGIGNSTNWPANCLNQYTSFGYDADGNMTQCGDWSYTYDSFGNTISQTGSLADAFSHRFSTKYYDAVVGLYYYGYRFYYASAMHWFNRDPKEEDAGINLYSFCDNNPVVA